MKGLIKVPEAAKLLGFCEAHIRHIIVSGRLKAEKIGRDYYIKKSELNKIRRERSPRGMRNALVNGMVVKHKGKGKK